MAGMRGCSGAFRGGGVKEGFCHSCIHGFPEHEWKRKDERGEKHRAVDRTRKKPKIGGED